MSNDTDQGRSLAKGQPGEIDAIIDAFLRIGFWFFIVQAFACFGGSGMVVSRYGLIVAIIMVLGSAYGAVMASLFAAVIRLRKAARTSPSREEAS